MLGIYSQEEISVTCKLTEREGHLGLSYKFGVTARHKPQQDQQGRVYVKKTRKFRNNPWEICS